MHSHLPIPSMPTRAIVEQTDLLVRQDLLFLILGMICLVAALGLLKRALQPIGVVVQALAAAVLVFLAVGAGLVFMMAAAYSAR